jgi:hypothetical protein
MHFSRQQYEAVLRSRIRILLRRPRRATDLSSSDSAIATLGLLGFSTDDSVGNFNVDLDVSDPPNFNTLADFMLKALHDGYRARADMKLRFNAPFAPRATSKCIPVS